MDKDHMDSMQLRPWTQLFRYPHDDAAGVVFTRADYECFLPNAPLNRTAVDFGFRLIVADVCRSTDRDDAVQVTLVSSAASQAAMRRAADKRRKAEAGALGLSAPAQGGWVGHGALFYEQGFSFSH